MPAHQGRITQRCRHENIGLASALNQIPQDFLPVGNHVLARGGFMIDIECFDVRCVIQQKGRNVDGGGDMKRCLPIAAPAPLE